jgi:hypothetical protein
MGKLRQKRAWTAYLIVAVAAMCQGGCLLVAAGAAGGAYAGYAYYQGRICQSYVANFEDAWAATHTALGELGMPVLSEEHQTNCGVIKTQTSDGDRVRIALDVIPSRIPAEGSLTRICVRVGTFGDHPVSERVLYQVGAHLVVSPVPCPMPASGPPPVANAPGSDVPIPTPGQTVEPPLTSSPQSSQSAPPASPPLLPPEPARLPSGN